MPIDALSVLCAADARSVDTGTLRTDKQIGRQTDRFAISISRVSMLTCDKKTQVKLTIVKLHNNCTVPY